jgi:hypothetical protein
MKLAISVALAALVFSSAGAMERTLTLQDFRVIQDGAGQARIAFRLPEIPSDRAIVVTRAQVAVTLPGAVRDRRLRLWVHPLTRDWNAGSATWTSPWTRPGGDLDEEARVAVEVDLRGNSAVFDLTPLVKEVVEEGRESHGFLLTRDPDDGIGIPIEDLDRFQGLSGATITVSYVRVGPRPSRQ